MWTIVTCLPSVQRIKFKVPGTRMCLKLPRGWSRVTIHIMLQCGQIQIPERFIKTALLPYRHNHVIDETGIFHLLLIADSMFIHSQWWLRFQTLQVNKGKVAGFPIIFCSSLKKKKKSFSLSTIQDDFHHTLWII